LENQKNPRCFRKVKKPLHYTNQLNAWFTKTVTWWWIKNVFWPWHVQNWGDVRCILLLDNCSAHDIDLEEVKAFTKGKLIIFFFPPNVTNTHQPADMGMIASMKVGYRVIMMTKLLDLFDAEGGYEQAYCARRRQPKGCQGLDFGGKATLLDAMKILDTIWSADAKYAKTDSILRCWRKAAILPLTWDCDINNDVGQASIATKATKISKEECNELCGLFQEIELRVGNDNSGNLSRFSALQGSFADDRMPMMTDTDRLAMAEEWACVEDDPIVFNADVEDMIEALENDEEDDDEEEGDANDDEESVVAMDIEDGNQKPAAKVTFLEAEECCFKISEYITTSGAPREIKDDILRIARRIRSHHVSKPRMTPTITKFLVKK